MRFLATTFLVVTVIFLVTGAKGYYLAGLLPPLVAAGCTWLTEWRPGWRPLLTGAVLALSAIVAWPALVPVLPTRAYTASFYPVIDADQPETIGWPSYVDQVRAVVASLPTVQRRTAVAYTHDYGEAGALEWYGVGVPVFSGHNGFQDWGPPPDGAGPVVVWGVEDPTLDFTGCTRRATLHSTDGADNDEDGTTVWVCAGPAGSWSRRWPDLSYYRA